MSALQTYQQPNGTMMRAAEVIESVLIQGDLSHLNPEQRVQHYLNVCRSLDINPNTKPFDYLHLNGKLILYAKRDCTDQLRGRDKVSVRIVSREIVDDLCLVTAQATTPDGRTDESVGAVNIAGLKGEHKANAMMKAETKAKRRVTLSICGLGFSDESEVESIGSPQVSQPAPRQIEQPKPGPSLDDCRRWIASAADLLALQSAWSEIPGHFKPDLAADKDARKSALTPKPAETPAAEPPLMAGDAIISAINGVRHEIGLAWSDAVERYGLECGIPLRDGITPKDLTAKQATELLAKLKAAKAA